MSRNLFFRISMMKSKADVFVNVVLQICLLFELFQKIVKKTYRYLKNKIIYDIINMFTINEFIVF